MNILQMIYVFYSDFFSYFDSYPIDSPFFRFIGFNFSNLGSMFTWLFTISTVFVLFWLVISLFIHLAKLIRSSLWL